MKGSLANERSPLQQFAEWFHQDFDVMFKDIASGGEAYLSQLSAKERAAVAAALRHLLAQHPGKSEAGLRNAWLRLGAEYWPKRGSTRALLEGFLK
ncbi:contact-dependent growth inhibition system immunity protein [Nevskia ramosa]|uniref:contact-dependent growth inhibition system immunity protein n=1 Tax=Nevskia ramosa TaxID=64002 RepID=UPI003D13A662